MNVIFMCVCIYTFILFESSFSLLDILNKTFSNITISWLSVNFVFLFDWKNENILRRCLRVHNWAWWVYEVTARKEGKPEKKGQMKKLIEKEKDKKCRKNNKGSCKPSFSNPRNIKTADRIDIQTVNNVKKGASCAWLEIVSITNTYKEIKILVVRFNS